MCMGKLKFSDKENADMQVATLLERLVPLKRNLVLHSDITGMSSSESAPRSYSVVIQGGQVTYITIWQNLVLPFTYSSDFEGTKDKILRG